MGLKFFDDISTQEWSDWVPQSNRQYTLGQYQQILTTDKKRFRIHIAQSNFDNVPLLINVLAHELAYAKLLGENYINNNDSDMEQFSNYTLGNRIICCQ